MSAITCASCVDVDRKGYCALGRCYCGHETCHGFASWTELPALVEVAPTPKKVDTSSWDAREEGSSWIDKL